MRLTTLVTVLSISITAQACSGYKYCHCYDSDGTPNDSATSTVCTKAGYQTKYNSDLGHYECYYYSETLFKNIGQSNCGMRERCIKAGATGKDSSCRGKV
ncbi:hypothetical protein CABS03_13094 [Colletotrichum abscissum]|uniref:Uncharacterized protein n=1 Tax=Colletotrichum abscissum TaxID=1671311 RepID=A0A9Q0B2K6_9PEZI|nr:hypothetical protein CABS02_09013 [Colletotrichum abscissum]